MTLVYALIKATMQTLNESSVYIIFGFSVAALIHILLDKDKVLSLLGEGRIRPIIMASILGAPLPLCSCSIIPTAISLKKKGVKNGPIFSFLISTPETGVDSIALTYGMMGWLMCIARPIAAVLTAVFSGYCIELFSKEEKEEKAQKTQTRQKLSAYTPKSFTKAFIRAFDEIFDDISLWLFIGLLISGALVVACPEDFFQNNLSPLQSMLIAAGAGIPIYVCASMSTPIAAVLMLKGFNPGAALVFLLLGPATNTASIMVIKKTFGLKLLCVYLCSLLFSSIVTGSVLNVVVNSLPVSIPYMSTYQESPHISPISILFTVIFILLTIRSAIRKWTST